MIHFETKIILSMILGLNFGLWQESIKAGCFAGTLAIFIVALLEK